MKKSTKSDKATAIGYKKEDFAPRILAHGKGNAAQELCKIARRHGIPIVESPELTEALSGLQTFHYIPGKFWIIVAEILNFVHETRKDDSA